MAKRTHFLTHKKIENVRTLDYSDCVFLAHCAKESSDDFFLLLVRGAMQK